MTRERTIRLGVAASGVGPVRAREACKRFGGWAAAVEHAEDLGDRFVNLRRALLRAARLGIEMERECAAKGIGFVLRDDPGWPPAFEALTDPPEALFYRGALEIASERAVAIVGARESSPQGRQFTERLAGRLAVEGWAVVSGLARGIDAAAHRGALSESGDTIAVLGCGPDVDYPPENRRLQATIAQQGLLLSEFPPGMLPQGREFPRRNRIIAALAAAVVIVECGVRSGARITAKYALEQGREIFVVPGWPGSPHSSGPLELLRQGARPIRHADDLFEDLGFLAGSLAREPDDVAALDAIRKGAGTASELSAALSVSKSEARERMAKLELLGFLPEEAH